MNAVKEQIEKKILLSYFVLFSVRMKRAGIIEFIALRICINTKDDLNKGNLFN